MGFAEQFTLSKNATFLSKVQIAIIKSAIAIRSESTSTPNHAKRNELAKRVLEAPEFWANNFSLGVVSNPVVSAESTDSDIEFTVNSMWDAFSA